MSEEIRLAESMWCEIGRKTNVGAAKENSSLELGNCVEKVVDEQKREDTATTGNLKKKEIEENVDDTAPCLSSSGSSDKEEQKTLERLMLEVEVTEEQITTPKVKINANTATPAVSTSTKRSCGCASSSDFVEVFNLSILQEKESGECD